MKNGLELVLLRTRIGWAGRLIALGLLAAAAPIQASDFAYTINPDNTITITGYIGPAGAVVIPAAIDGKAVTAIGDHAFEYNDYPDGVTIGNNVTNIGNYAFNQCPSLRSAVIGDSVTRIGDSAFYDCAYLSSVTLGNGVTSLGDRAFSDCNRLVNVAIGSRLTRIGSWAFWCTSLTTIMIPDSVTAIGGHAFADCTDLYNVTLGAGVANVGDLAFANCLSLTYLYCHGNAPALGSYVFDGVYNATLVNYLPGTTGWETTFGGFPTVRWDGPPPDVPAGISASDGAYLNKIQVSWNNSSGATAYLVFRNISNDSAGAVQVGTTWSTTYDDLRADIGPIYYYWVKAVNAAGASAFSAPASGRTHVEGPLITANGGVYKVYLNSGEAVSIAVAMLNMEDYFGADVDWWAIAFAHSGEWYYLDSAMQWTPFNGDFEFCRPVHQGPLGNVSATKIPDKYQLPRGAYDFWFAIDYPMDGILDPYGQIVFDKVTVIVQ